MTQLSVATLFSSVMVVRVLSKADWDPIIFVAFGGDATPPPPPLNTLSSVSEIYLRGAQGYDGRFFFVQANDPG